jgi:putative phage-type endonuclease
MVALVQQSEQWLELRRSKIGASDAPVIMGVSPWSTPYKLWNEKLGFTLPKFQSKHMLDGLEIEDSARNIFFLETGILVDPEIIFHPEHEFMMASLDGISKDKKTILEIKKPNYLDHKSASLKIVPNKYYPQLQHQMSCCELDKTYYLSYRSDEDYHLFVVERDDKYIKKMIKQEEIFYDKLISITMPDLLDRDYEVKDSELWKCTVEEYLSVSNQIKSLEAKEKELRNILIHQCNNQSSTGYGVKIGKSIRRGAVDYSAIPELEGVNLNKYRKDSIEVWTIKECN